VVQEDDDELRMCRPTYGIDRVNGVDESEYWEVQMK
jgi:hypothetical protein